MDDVRPLDAFPLINTCNFEELRASITHIYAEPKMDVMDRGTVLPVTINHCQLEHIVLSYGSYGADVWMQFPETTFVSKIFPLKGRGAARIDGRTFPITPGHGVVVSGDQDLILTNYAGYERLILRVNAAVMASKLGALLGDAIRSPLKFSPAQDDSTPANDALRRHFMFLVQHVNSSAGSLPNLVRAEFEQALIAMFLHANRHNYSDVLACDPADVASVQVRRAEEYIEANWDRPMTLEVLAALTDASVSGLFRSFMRIRGYSPTNFTKQVRLRHARALLRHPVAATTVAEVASVCGYASLRRFCDDYYTAFGEQPSATLCRGRGEPFTTH